MSKQTAIQEVYRLLDENRRKLYSLSQRDLAREIVETVEHNLTPTPADGANCEYKLVSESLGNERVLGEPEDTTGFPPIQ